MISIASIVSLSSGTSANRTKPVHRCWRIHIPNVEALGPQLGGTVPGRRDEEEQSLLVPGASGRHACALDEDNKVVDRVGGRQCAAGSVQVIERHIDNALTPPRRHFSEQYFTFAQSRAHFLRHSNGRPHRSQFLGGCPFLSLATRGISIWVRADRERACVAPPVPLVAS